MKGAERRADFGFDDSWTRSLDFTDEDDAMYEYDWLVTANPNKEYRLVSYVTPDTGRDTVLNDEMPF